MWRLAAVCLISTAAATAQNDAGVERWLAGGPRADIQCSTHVSPVSLSRFQRLAVRLSIRAEGREIERRRGKGELLMMVQLKDASGKNYETHRTIDLREPPYTSARHVDFAEWI